MSETKIMSNQPAADASTGHVSSIPTRDPSPFDHDRQSSWRSEDISSVLLGGITALTALLALGIKYIFVPLCARGQQSGRNQAIVQKVDFLSPLIGQESTNLEALELSSGSHDITMPLEIVQPQSRAGSGPSDDMNETSAT